MKNLLCAVVGLALSTAFADTLTWTGLGTTDNMSEAANWTPARSPAVGDSLAFAGETRTTPVNDIDNASFRCVVFTNDGSDGRAASFTLSGKPIEITHPYGFGVNKSSVELTETIDLDLSFTPTAQVIMGGMSGVNEAEGSGLVIQNVTTHHITFNGTLTGPGAARLETTGQFRSVLRFNGRLSGFSEFYRPNGGGHVYLSSDNTGCFEKGYAFNEGHLHVSEPANMGSAFRYASGQPLYATAGYLYVAATRDQTFSMELQLNAPSQQNDGMKIYLENAGPLMTFSGDVKEVGTTGDAGTRLQVDGPGDGRFTGSFLTDRMSFYKNGTGTWTLGSEIGSCAMTGLVTVAKGTLRIDCPVPTTALQVKSNAHLGGIGAIGPEDGSAQVVFEQNTAVDLGTDADSVVLPLTFRGTVALAGPVTVNLPAGARFDASGRTLLLSYGAKTGVGGFAIGANFPAGTVFSSEETGLYAVTPSQECTWTGATSGVWDTSSENFEGGAYSDGFRADFPDLSDATKRTVSVPDVVRPQSVKVRPGTAHDYVFTGAGGVADAVSLVFDGPGTTTWQAPIARVNALEVRQGRLILEGDVSETAIHVLPGAALELRGRVTDGTILVDNGGAFEQTASSVIGGTTAVTLRNVGAIMRGANTYTGGLTVGESLVDGSANPEASLLVYDAKAIGETGDVTVCFNSVIESYVTIEEEDRTLVLEGYNQHTFVRMNDGTSLIWHGDIRFRSYIQSEAIRLLGSGGRAELGKPDGTSVVGFEIDRSVTLAQGPFHLYAAYQAPRATLGSRGELHLYNSANQFKTLHLAYTKCHTWAKDVITPGAEIVTPQRYLKHDFSSELHLHGFDQTISSITPDYDPDTTTSIILESDRPATLTLTGDSTNVDPEVYSVQGELTLRKSGEPGTKWTLGVTNTSTGDLEVLGGTLSIAAAESMPAGRDSTLRIAATGAVLDLPDGVAAVVGRGAVVNGLHETSLASGLYGGAGCAAADVRKVPWITGSGTLEIRRGEGLVLFVR